MAAPKQEDRPLRIAFIGHKRIPSREGGVEVVVDRLATRYAAMGYDVTVYNRSGRLSSGDLGEVSGDGKHYRGVRIVTVPTFQSNSLNAIVYSVLASFMALFGRYDVIHYHAEGPCIMLWLPKLFGIPVVATVHGLDWQRAKWSRFASAMILKGERTAVKHADEIIVLSENVREYFRSTYGRRTHYIANGIDTPVPAVPAEIKSLYGLSGDDYFLFVARIVPEKGLHYLIRAFRETDTKLKLIIAGANGGSQEYADQVRSLSGGDDRIRFAGFVQGKILDELYTNCRAFVLPSDVEGMSVSLLEAMSFGALCVVSDIPENLEVVGDRAVSFPKGDVKALGEILKKISDDPGFVSGKRKGVSEYITSRYSWDKAADETLKLYRKVLRPGRRDVPASGDSDENSDDQ